MLLAADAAGSSAANTLCGLRFCCANHLQLTSLRRLLDDDIMEHLEHITELSDK